MKTVSLESTPAADTFSFKSALALLGQWFGAFIAFIVAMIVAEKNGAQERLPATGLAVGLLTDFKFAHQTHQIGKGDLLFAFIDGVPDSKNSQNEFFERERLLGLLDPKIESTEALLGRIETRLREHVAEAEQFDDITMLAAKRLE